MSRNSILLLVGSTVIMIVALTLPAKSTEDPAYKRLAGTYAAKAQPSVDHSKFPQLNRKFKSPQEVTEACVSCHNKRHIEVMNSVHWNWSRKEYVKGRGIIALGKKNVLNNFCVGVSGNEQSCAKCHIGYGNKGHEFDYKNWKNIDCLACHDNSNTYVKGSGMAGLPAKGVDLTLVAQHVGRPTRSNCGACHFFGGGGNNVKHGDLEKALLDADRNVDVHMGVNSSDMQCVDCHTADKHQIVGKVYSIASMNTKRVECQSCHGELPHADGLLNEHVEKVACQSCHIPTYATVNPTKVAWDWSTAGKLKNGKPYEVKGPDGMDTYMSIKGSFKWGKNLKPDYVWFNGTASHYLVGDKVEKNQTVVMNKLNGSYEDPDAKITPVKIHRAMLPYDEVHKWIIQPKTVSTKPGDGGFWKEFDWHKAAAAGSKEVGLPFSGKLGFIKTEMYWPINHMVTPKDKVVACAECHTRENGRLANLRDFYLPGRDRNIVVDTVAEIAIWATLAAIAVHASLRIASALIRRSRNGKA